MENKIAGWVFGFLAMAITFLSYQMNTKRSLLAVQTVSTLCTCLSFLFLEATTGFVLNIVCIIRNLLFYFFDTKPRLYRALVALLTVLMVALGFLSWQGAISLLMIAALAANTIILSLGKPQLLRKSVVVTSSMIWVYNLIFESYGGMASESVAIISSLIGIFRYRKEKNKSENMEKT